MKKLIGALMTL
jgi:hypothetical protein